MASFRNVAVAMLTVFDSGAAIQTTSPGELRSGGGCATDADCPFSGTHSKCCPIDGRSTYGCTPHKVYSGKSAACHPPGTAGEAPVQCACVVPEPCDHEAGETIRFLWPYEEAKPEMKQWLMVGDSISWGIFEDARVKAKEHGIQMVHTPGNALNLWRGARCINEWLGEDSKRWDIISFNFGLHDLSQSLERIEPEIYAELLGTFTEKAKKAAPRAALLWASTTPAPDGSQNACDTSVFQPVDGLPPKVPAAKWGGCPPRKPSDIPVYNDAASKALNAMGTNVTTVDLYGAVTKQCGEKFSWCEEFYRPMEVHMGDKGNAALAEVYVEAVARVVG